MHLNTFPCTVNAIHSTGLIVVDCPAIGYRNLFLTDDHGNLLAADHAGAALYSARSGMEH